MSELSLTKPPVMKTGMLIRKPADEVYEAFIEPKITTQFWFTKSSGRLDAGQPVKWEWEMYNASTMVTVKALEPGKRILIEWEARSGRHTVEWLFRPLAEGTFVSITNEGFAGSGDAVAAEAMDSTQGFSLLLAGLKAYLEHGIRLNLVLDRKPLPQRG